MRQLGVSIYPSQSQYEADKEYLDLARKYGFTRIFTSLLEIVGDQGEVINKFKKIIEYGNSIGMETILDINPSLFKQLNISYDDLKFFKDLGATGIRLDLGFTGAEEAAMTRNPYGLIIEINMSSGTKYIDNIMSYQPDIDYLYASHNFYPQKYTGISQDHFEQTTSVFNQNRIHTGAFVTSQHGELGPWPVQKGLCTLEHHRNRSIHTQVTHFRLMGTIDDLLIGNAYATEDELRTMSQAYLNSHPAFEIELFSDISEVEKKIVLDEIHQYRGDRSEYMIRSTSTRIKYKAEDFPANNTVPIKKGDILICNNHFGHYKGETQIALTDMDNDDDRNVVGRLTEESTFLLDYLKPWTSFVLKKI
ncbi:DUF871 domain-containing protein [Bacillus sp. T33-2]|uniref:DUF871 domain-containing protein n=1 Tax=Bacillus sp. T33-2 TaxID=2054168 RepID=UPI000C7701BB|nr:MupG family TIM beta-alpha barrel fold protein [Bacillus sp. T33-2]PLR98520.1 DUF871 domain-containing protein [Bacillus sp. T33-2]